MSDICTKREDHSVVECELSKEESRSVKTQTYNKIKGKNGKTYIVTSEQTQNRKFMQQLSRGGVRDDKKRSKNKEARKTRKKNRKK